MKTRIFIRLLLLQILILLPGGCKEDNDGVSQFSGNYVIASAELTEALTVSTNEMGNIPLPAGTGITQAIQAALLSAVTCTSADKSYVELREDYSLYLSCEGDNPLNAGTWDEVSATTIRLNLNNTAVPTSPAGVVLTVSEVEVAGSTLTGKTLVPLPKVMIAALLAPMQLTLSEAAPDIFLVKITLEFTRK